MSVSISDTPRVVHGRKLTLLSLLADLAVACLGVIVMVLFFFATLPEISEEDMFEAEGARGGKVDDRPLYKRVSFPSSSPAKNPKTHSRRRSCTVFSDSPPNSCMSEPRSPSPPSF